MERESMLKEVKEEAGDEPPEFGAGSEFGRKEKEQARRRRFEKRKTKQNNSPWVLKVCGKNGKKYKGIREGGVTENTSYYVFFQAPDGAFEAFPVNEWYNFTPFQRYNTMSLEEAEEKFTKRGEILNYFTLKTMNKTKEGGEEGDSKKAGPSVKKEFKVSDMDDWYDSENEMKSESGSDDEEKPKTKNSKNKKKDKKKKKKDSDDENDEEPLEESDEGDYDDKEVDYMSDSSSSDGEEEDTKDELKGVEDESALRELGESEEEDEEEEQNKEGADQQAEDKLEGDKKAKVKGEKNGKFILLTFSIPCLILFRYLGDESGSDSEFDSDNSDIDESKTSSLFMLPRKGIKIKTEPGETTTAVSLESKTENKLEPKTGPSAASTSSQQNGLKLKHKLDTPISPHPSKKQKTSNESTYGITEEAVRRYLLRKPMTPKDLLAKFKSKAPNCDRQTLVEIIGQILKKINPEKQIIQKKLYFSLKPT